MAFLRYSEVECEIEQDLAGDPGIRDAISVFIRLAPERWRALALALGEIKNREGSELRTDFPRGWTIFWKIRDGESRFFVAHPEPDQWVATLALSENHLERIRDRLASGEFEGPLSKLEAVSRMSNVEVHTRQGAVS
jgi:hypothetical protein